MENRPKMLIEGVRDVLRVEHYARRTEKSYVNWIKRYVTFHHRKHPRDMGGAEIEAFLTHLAVQENIAASRQNQALSALLFLYREVLQLDVDLKIDAVRAKPSQYLPTVLTKDEVMAIIQGPGAGQKAGRAHGRGDRRHQPKPDNIWKMLPSWVG